jgi:hypothetical protein
MIFIFINRVKRKSIRPIFAIDYLPNFMIMTTKTLSKIASFVLLFIFLTGIQSSYAQSIDSGQWREVCSGTNNSCDDSIVSVYGKDGLVTVHRGEERFIEFRDYVKEVVWVCGASNEKSTCKVGFLAVSIRRNVGDNRRLEVHFYARK